MRPPSWLGGHEPPHLRGPGSDPVQKGILVDRRSRGCAKRCRTPTCLDEPALVTRLRRTICLAVCRSTLVHHGVKHEVWDRRAARTAYGADDEFMDPQTNVIQPSKSSDRPLPSGA